MPRRRSRGHVTRWLASSEHEVVSLLTRQTRPADVTSVMNAHARTGAENDA